MSKRFINHNSHLTTGRRWSEDAPSPTRTAFFIANSTRVEDDRASQIEARHERIALHTGLAATLSRGRNLGG